VYPISGESEKSESSEVNRRIFIQVKTSLPYADPSLRAFIDSGRDDSLIDERFVTGIHNEPTKTMMVDDTKIKDLKQFAVELSIESENAKRNMALYSLKNLGWYVLLGADWCLKVRAQLRWKKGAGTVMFVKKEEFNFMKKVQKLKVFTDFFEKLKTISKNKIFYRRLK
jgi:hypothetical protein